jgi:hypothetical protein
MLYIVAFILSFFGLILIQIHEKYNTTTTLYLNQLGTFFIYAAIGSVAVHLICNISTQIALGVQSLIE